MKSFRPSKWIKPKNNKIYIVPNGYGLGFFFTIVIIFLSGAAYDNNLIFLLAFVLFSIFFISMIHSHQNLKNLQIKSIKYFDQEAHTPLQGRILFYNGDGESKYNLEIQPNSKKLRTTIVSSIPEIYPQANSTCTFQSGGLERGVHTFPSVKISTTFPLGIFHVWTVLMGEDKVYIYPQPKGQLESNKNKLNDLSVDQHLTATSQQGSEFREHLKHNKGDSYQRIDWKLYAKQKKLYTKKFGAESSHAHSFSLNDLKHLNIEERLSQLSKWILHAEKQSTPYELILDKEKIPIGHGKNHLRICQRALAEYKEAEHD